MIPQLARYRELFEFAPDPYLITDLHGIIEESNQAAADLFMLRKEFLAGKPLPFLIASEERREFYTSLGALLQARQPVQEWDFTLQPLRGHAIHALIRVSPVVEDGAVVGFRWLIRDVSIRRRMEAELRAQKAFAEALLEEAAAAVLVLDSTGRIVRVNAFTESATGQTRREMIDQLWCDLLPEEDRPPCEDALSDLLLKGHPLRRTGGLLDREGTVRAVEWSGTRLIGSDGQSLALLVGHDITELKEAQRQALHWERLAAVDRMAAGLAHESRNAVQRSQACLDRLVWLLEGQPDALDLVARARKAQDDLMRVYESVREYAGPLGLQRQSCELARAWREAWKQVAHLHLDPAPNLSEEMDTNDTRCVGDHFRFVQVFRNLLENAVAASPAPATVTILCRDADLGGRPALEAAIRDRGPGLSAEQRRHLFEPFYTTKPKGTGLGMAIAKRIVEAHGGEIAAGDAPGGGAEVRVLVPRSQP
jgi:PAS domain S-box-containing protein